MDKTIVKNICESGSINLIKKTLKEKIGIKGWGLTKCQVEDLKIALAINEQALADYLNSQPADWAWIGDTQTWRMATMQAMKDNPHLDPTSWEGFCLILDYTPIINEYLGMIGGEGLTKTIMTFKIDGHVFELDRLLDTQNCNGKNTWMYNLSCDGEFIQSGFTRTNDAKRFAKMYLKEEDN